MKLKIKSNYWTQKNEWQKIANINLWIIIIFGLIIETTLILRKATTYYIIIGIFLTLYILPQKISYHLYKKEESRKLREKIIKEAKEE